MLRAAQQSVMTELTKLADGAGPAESAAQLASPSRFGSWTEYDPLQLRRLDATSKQKPDLVGVAGRVRAEPSTTSQITYRVTISIAAAQYGDRVRLLEKP